MGYDDYQSWFACVYNSSNSLVIVIVNKYTHYKGVPPEGHIQSIFVINIGLSLTE